MRPGHPPKEVFERSRILEMLEARIASQRPVRIAVAKVEGMKSFNHAHGIRVGDQLLSILGERIVSVLDGVGHVGTLSGDVFLSVEDDHGDGGVSDEFIASAVAALSQPLQLGDIDFRPRFKLGIASARPGEGDADQLIVEASAAMRAAAASPLSDIVTADREIRTSAHLEGVVDRDLPRALSDGELSFAYQPLVTLHDSAVHGAEALLRWNHPEVGFVDPGLVIARAEAIGLTREFTAWSASRITSEWARALGENEDLRGLAVSINLNERQLADRECAAMVHDAIRSSELKADGLIIEVVESGRIGDLAEASLRALADAGSIIVLDDFGTGFNALEYFLRFPVHGIKFDRSLTHSIASNHTSLVIVQGVAEVADRLGVATVGEGIETSDDAAMCRDLGLTFGQGWHFGRPVSLDEFVADALANRAERPRQSLDRRTFLG